MVSPMHSVLQRNLFFVKEHAGMFKAANEYDVLDPQSQQKLIDCREPNLGFFTKLLRFTDYKRMTPFEVVLTAATGEKVLTVKRGVSLFASVVQVLDENDQLVGTFKQKLFSFNAKFDVLDPAGAVVCTLKGNWRAWDFRFMQGETELAVVNKKWAGLGKELFTTADNYMLSIADTTPTDSSARILIMAAVMCIDMVLKE